MFKAFIEPTCSQLPHFCYPCNNFSWKILQLPLHIHGMEGDALFCNFQGLLGIIFMSNVSLACYVLELELKETWENIARSHYTKGILPIHLSSISMYLLSWTTAPQFYPWLSSKLLSISDFIPSQLSCIAFWVPSVTCSSISDLPASKDILGIGLTLMSPLVTFMAWVVSGPLSSFWPNSEENEV